MILMPNQKEYLKQEKVISQLIDSQAYRTRGIPPMNNFLQEPRDASHLKQGDAGERQRKRLKDCIFFLQISPGGKQRKKIPLR